MKYFLIFICLGILVSANDVWDKKVYTFGNLTQVLKEQGRGDTISLKSLKKYTSVYFDKSSKYRV